MTIRRPAIFASAYAPHRGGVEELCRQLVMEQQRRDMAPVIATMRWPKSLPAKENIDGIPVLRQVFRVPEPGVRYLAGWAAFGAATQRALTAQLRDHGVDLVHVQCVSSNARYAVAAARDLQVPLVVSMQGELTMDATGLYQRSAQQRRSWRRLLDAAAAVTACSQSVLDEARASYDGDWFGRSRVVPNGVRVADFDSAPAALHPRRYILGVGRMVPQKGFDVLLRAFAEIAKDIDIDLVLGGDGPELSSLRSLADQLQLGERVQFVGSLDRESVVAAFTGAAVFVLPSRQEPQGIVVLEAMAAGTPVLATAVGGVPETVRDGTNGVLTPPEDHQVMARHLRELLGDDDLIRRLVTAGRATARSRDWPAIADDYDAVYRDVT